MLKKRSRGVTSPQAIIDDHGNNSWLQHEKSMKTSSFFLNSPKFFKGFFSNSSSLSPSDSTVNDPTLMSPTSILDTKAFSAFANSFWIVDNKNPKTLSTQHSWEQPNTTKGIGLALIDENSTTEPNNNNNNDDDENNNTTSSTTKQQRRKLVVFGSQLRIQVPPLPQPSVFPCFSPDSPREFGIKTPKNNLWRFGNKDSQSQVHPQNMSPLENGIIISEKGNEENISLSDMELSEDYTCVKHNGPNPKTTHIFGNCIVESCCGVVGTSFSARRNGSLSKFESSIDSNQIFLSFCHHCKKKLCEGSDIYMYRGEKAFCSQECRCQEMLFDGIEN